jgi:hypothetical protein
MGSGLNDWDDDDGLPDAAFTEDELAAGVQHIMRTGDPDATSSGRRPVSWSLEPVDDGDEEGDCAKDAGDVPYSSTSSTLRFETYDQARAWAKVNPGRVITRGSDDHGFEAKPARHKQSVNPVQRGIDSYLNRRTEIKALAPHLHDVLTKSASNSSRLVMRPFYPSTWQAELNRLSGSQLKRLRLLVAIHLEDNRKDLRMLYAAMRQFQSMKAGQYGEALNEKLNEVMEGALADIDMRLTGGCHI